MSVPKTYRLRRLRGVCRVGDRELVRVLDEEAVYRAVARADDMVTPGRIAFGRWGSVAARGLDGTGLSESGIAITARLVPRSSLLPLDLRTIGGR